MVRPHGSPPFAVAVVHGGPGAPGSMAPVARRLSTRRGVLEPLQTALTVETQVAELAGVLHAHGTLPMTLIGHSWGAWLSMLTAAEHPALVQMVVLVGSGPFEERYADGITATRLARLDPPAQAEVEALFKQLGDAGKAPDPERLARLAALLAPADQYDPLPPEPGELPFEPHVYRRVWPEAAAMRRSGALLEAAHSVRCPVVALHGDYDPHPADGVRVPLANVLPDFRFILIERCGHEPWRERQASERFYELLEGELG